jgi:putative nucleotidyltransferase with HDIG domain
MNVHELVRSVKNLPSPPKVLVRLLEVVRNPDNGSEHVLDVLQIDPALTAEVMRVSNTAYFSSNPAGSLDEAVARLGYIEVYRIAARIPAGEMLSGPIEPLELGAGELWQHSVACAIIADELGKRMDLPEGVAYTAGLLHDIGKLVLREAAGSDYARVFTLVEAEQVTLDQAERTVFGYDYAEVGGALLEEWKFPAELHNAVRFQNNPAACPEPRVLAASILVSNWLAAVIGCNHGRDVWAINIDDSVTKLVDLQPEDMDRLIVTTNKRLRAAQDFLAAAPTF